MSNLFKPLVITPEIFNRLYELPIGDLVTQRMSGGFTASYLTWAHAIRVLKEELPDLFVAFEESNKGGFSASVIHIHEIDHAQNLWNAYVMPYLTDGECRTPAIFFPVMDNRFGATESPDARAISDACQRGAVKAIATFTGLGLKLYAGEDIPSGPKVSEEVKKIVEEADRVTPLVDERKHVAKKASKKPSKKTPKETPNAVIIDPKDAPDAGTEKPWSSAVIPFGKNKGKTLGEMSDNQIKWYYENYEADANYPDNQILRDHLDSWFADTQGEMATGDDIIVPNDEFTQQSQETINEMEKGDTDSKNPRLPQNPDPDLDEEVPF